MEHSVITLTTLILIGLILLNISTKAYGTDATDVQQPWFFAHQRKSTNLTTKIPLPNKTKLIATTTTSARTIGTTTTIEPDVETNDQHRNSHYHPPPSVVQKPRLIQSYDKRALDGDYEYRYELSNGDVRYERAYWIKVGNKKVLARKGYYSYPLPNHRFHTVFYTADHNGYRADESYYTRTQPILARSLEPTPTAPVPVQPPPIQLPSLRPSPTPSSHSTDIGNEKPANEMKKKIQINRKAVNQRTPLAKTILQKGRIGAIVPKVHHHHHIEENEKERNRRTIRAEASSTGITSLGEAEMETSESSVTNRPQINIEATMANAIETNSSNMANGIQTEEDDKVPKQPEEQEIDEGEREDEASRAISGSIGTGTINRIKARSLQTTIQQTATKQPEELIDTTTVLSVD